MKKILSNLKENWITYGFETIVVIVGILIAFGLNNWNEGRKNRQLENYYLKRLIEDLTEDINYCDSKSKTFSENANALDRFMSEIHSTQNDLEEVVNLLKNLRIGTDEMVSQDGTFRELTSTGDLKLFENKLLKDKIVEYYRMSEYTFGQFGEFNDVSTDLFVLVWHEVKIKVVSEEEDVPDFIPIENWQYFNDPSSSKFQSLINMASLFSIRNKTHSKDLIKLKNQATKLLSDIMKEIE